MAKKIMEFGVFLSEERLTKSSGRPSIYKHTVDVFLESAAPQARIQCKDAKDANSRKHGYAEYLRAHKIPASAHLHGSSVVLVKEG